jgi:GNAT superfamily N-acetyltransferase
MEPTERVAGFTRPLGLADLEDCRALSDEACWNQTDDDWRLIFDQAHTRGVELEGRVIASAAVMPYGARIGWICMVLVAMKAHRQGYATQLMHWATAHARTNGLVPGLDATPDGREVYRQLGYCNIYGVTRMRAVVPVCAVPVGMPGLAPMMAQDLAAVVAHDVPCFGADRRAVLVDLHRRTPQAAHIVRNVAGELRGFVLARNGARAAQIGPLVAKDPATAVALFEAALGTLRGPVIVDVPDAQEDLLSALILRGFVPERPFTRMLHGTEKALGRPADIYALTGPEFA